MAKAKVPGTPPVAPNGMPPDQPNASTPAKPKKPPMDEAMPPSPKKKTGKKR